MRRFLALLLAFGTTVAAVHADGLSPAGTAVQGMCYASGASGPRVPCVLQGQTWTRVLRPTDDASAMTFGGRPLQSLLLDATPAGRAAVEQGVADTLTAAPAGGVSRSQAERLADTANVLDYRLPGDADDAPAFRRAIATGKAVRVPMLTAGYDVGSQVTVPAGTHIVFEGTSRVRSTSASSIFRLTGFDTPSSIVGRAVFDMAGAPAGATAVRFGTNSGTPIYRVTLADFRCENAPECIGDEPSVANYVVDIVTRNIVAERTRGRQFYIRRSRGFFTVDYRVDHTYNTGQVTWEAVRFEDLAGLDIQKVDVVGPLNARVPTVTYQPSAIGVVLANPIGGPIASVYINGRILVDNTRGPAVRFENIKNVIGGQTQIYGNLGQGFYASGCADMDVNITAVGALGVSAATTEPLVQFEGCERVRGRVAARFGPGSGVYLHNSTDSVLDVLATDNAGYGLVEDGGGRNRVSGTMKGGGGSVVVTGTQSVAINYYGNDGLFRSGPTTGPVP